MNESPESQVQHELPKPHTAEAGHNAAPSSYEDPAGFHIEKSLSNPETSHSGGVASAATGMASTPALDSSQGASGAVPSPMAHVTPVIADDGDIIEKEWVDKAKHIVNATRMDPRQENKEINKFKADYIKKRYNKVIKVNEE